MKRLTKKHLVFLMFVIVSLSILNFASAVDTEINVRTLPDRTVSVYVLDASQTYYLLQSYHLATDWRGFLSVSYSGSVSDINVRVVVKEDKKTVLSERFGPYKAGNPIYIQALPGNLSKDYREFEKNSSVNNTSNNTSSNSSNTTAVKSSESVTNALSNYSNNLTSNATKETLKNNNLSGWSFIKIEKETFNLILKIVVILVILVILIILLKRYGRKIISLISSIRPPHLRRGVLSSKESNIDLKLKKAEKKLEEAQREIERIKREEKIKEVKKRLQEDLEELNRLKRGL